MFFPKATEASKLERPQVKVSTEPFILVAPRFKKTKLGCWTYSDVTDTDGFNTWICRT